ncbi:hypothetical protein JCM21738_2438 [Mesobacillus boroniphilus JCM 21738]|uniref:Uncharacterized protein n=1 Tax=Mesobacillus boroniphilus JCM 21738 TaxID=1294265 RepID=W4RMG1_9BACI|nr:hypothetical protein JCM21738_2438 [Mesobacillus boroniphilus JCM 21738]
MEIRVADYLVYRRITGSFLDSFLLDAPDLSRFRTFLDSFSTFTAKPVLIPSFS